MCHTAKFNFKLSCRDLQHLFGNKHNPTHGLNSFKAYGSNQASQFMPLIWYNPGDCIYINAHGVTMLTGFPRTKWSRPRFSERFEEWISVKITQILEFRVITGITVVFRVLWPGCAGAVLPAPFGSRVNDYVKSLIALGFWQHNSPCSLLCWTNNTLVAWS